MAKNAMSGSTLSGPSFMIGNGFMNNLTALYGARDYRGLTDCLAGTVTFVEEPV